MKGDVILETYDLLYNARVHKTNTFGTLVEAEYIRELIYCGAYEKAVREIRRIKGGRGGGAKKRNEAIRLLRSLYAPKIVKIHLGSSYVLPDGTSSISVALEKFRVEHPECEQFYGDMRKDKVPCKTVYRLFVYDPNTKVNTYKYVFIERR